LLTNFLANYDAGPYFRAQSHNYIIYEYPENIDELKQDISSRNLILARAEAGIEWIRGIDADNSKFDGINFTPSSEIYSIKWTNNFIAGNTSPPSSRKIAYHSFALEITLNKSDFDRNFTRDQDAIHAANTGLIDAVTNDINVSNQSYPTAAISRSY